MPKVAEQTRVKKTFEAVVKGVNAEDYTVEVEVSDASIDRDEEIILPSAYSARLASYLSNPILCWSHPLCQEDPDPEDCIGKALSVVVTGNALVCKFQYAVEENEKAALIWRLVAGGYLKAFSIGALVYDYVSFWDDPAEIAAIGGPAGEALRAGQVWRVITDCELVEVSQVLVGCNRNALIRAFRENSMGSLEAFKSLFARPAPKAIAAPVAPPAAAPAPVLKSAASDPTEEEQFEALLNENPDLAEAFLDLLVEDFD